MTILPCISNFKTPFDERPDWAHCAGEWNVTVRGVEWSVDFDTSDPVIGHGADDVTDWLSRSARDEIIAAAIRAHDEDLP